MRSSFLVPRRGATTLLSLNKGPPSLSSLARGLGHSPVCMLSLASAHNTRQVRCFGTSTRNLSGAANDTKSSPIRADAMGRSEERPAKSKLSSSSPSSSVESSSSCGDSCTRSDDRGAPAPIDTRVGRFLFTGTPNEFIELVHLSDVLVVNFTAKWCKPCIEIEPEWLKLIQYFTYERKGSDSAAGSGVDESTTSSSTAKTTSVENEPFSHSSEEDDITVTFVDIDISVNDTLSALHDVRCVPTYGCYIGGREGRRRTEESGASSSNGGTSKRDSADTASGGTAESKVVSKSSSSSVGTTAETNVKESEGEVKVSSGSSVPPELGYESRGLFGTVEGAHLNKVHDMIEAAIKEIAKDRREGLFFDNKRNQQERS